MNSNIRVITPSDRLHHELKKIHCQLELLLAEYESEREQPEAEPPPVSSFKLIVNQLRDQTRDRSGRPKRMSLIPSRG